MSKTEIVLNNWPAQSVRYTEVFGVPVFGHSSISDAKFQHVASVLAGFQLKMKI